jgi:hypothetical protein
VTSEWRVHKIIATIANAKGTNKVARHRVDRNTGDRIGIICGIYGLNYWLPQIVKGMATDIGLDTLMIDPCLEGDTLVRLEADSFYRFVCKIPQSPQPNEYRWHALDNEQPLPSTTSR